MLNKICCILIKDYQWFSRILVFSFFGTLLFSCNNNKSDIEGLFSNKEENKQSLHGISIEYPKEGTIFPPEFPAPEFLWGDSLNSQTRWHIRLQGNNGRELYQTIVRSTKWRPDSSSWRNIKSASRTDTIHLTIIGEQRNFNRYKYSSGRSSFSFSQDSVGGLIFYRAVPLPFGYAVKNVNQIEWYLGNIDGSKPKKILDNIPVCANCHSFSGNGVLAMDIDYANDKGSYIIANIEDTIQLSFDKIITWNDFKKEDGVFTYGLLSQISPDGRFVLSTVKDRSVFVPVDNLEYSQLFFPIKGIIAVYDRESRKFYELKGACDKNYVQSNPNWSPNSTEIMYSRANRYMSSKIDNSESVLLKVEDAEEFVTRQKDFKFDLYRLKFNDGEGDQAIPVEGASDNGKSNFFARYSPDGKWVVFCQSEDFMLLQPDSKLFIMPSNGGQPRLMNCNTNNMNSWHAWSPNSRWLVFSSKCKGPYTQLFITHIDKNGNDSPPVFLENMAYDKKAVNIPEFIGGSGNNLKKITDNFSQNTMYFNRLAGLNISDKEYKKAIDNLNKALTADSLFFDAIRNKIVLNIILGQYKSKEDLHDKMVAARLIEQKIQKNPDDELLYIQRGELRLLTDDFEGALKDGFYIIKDNPKNFSGYDLITVAYKKMGKWSNTIPYYEKMLKMQPDNIKVTYTLAIAYQNVNQFSAAHDLLNDLIKKYPNEANFYISRAKLSTLEGDKKSTKDDYEKALEIDPDNYNIYAARGNYLKNSSDGDLWKKDFNMAILLIGKEIEKNPQDATLLITRAEIMEEVGDVETALKEYENYLKTWPLNYSAMEKIALFSSLSGQWQKAIEAYTTLIENFPGNASVLYNRSLTYQHSGELNKALSDINDAINLDPANHSYYFQRSNIKYNLGDKAGSKNDLNNSFTLLNEQSRKRNLNQKELEMLATIQKLLKDDKMGF
jgi:tetratricopeptide (TPR) repeat protein